MQTALIDWKQKLKDARRVSVPLVAINTVDPAETMRECADALNGKEDTPYLMWDVVNGFTGRNAMGVAVKAATIGTNDESIQNPLVALTTMLTLPGRLPAKDGRPEQQATVIFFHLAPKFIGDPVCIQALWNLRDHFKADGRMLILMGKQFSIPAELETDIQLIDEPLPSREQLKGIIEQTYRNAGDKVTKPKVKELESMIDALQGTSAFAAEQLSAMNIKSKGISVDQLWEAKCKAIEQTPGLKVFRDGGRFEDIGGYDVVKGFLGDIMKGDDPPNCIVFVDEIEKMLSGSSGDTSGVSADQLQQMLVNMQDTNADGVILLGHPGGGKSEIAKATGNEGGIPTIQLDLGGLKGSLVGQSEQQLRQAFKVIDAISNKRALWIATCNSINNLPSELRRRFKLGVFMCDLPEADACEKIWQIYEARYNVQRAGFSDYVDWTGAEIRNCCHIAKRLKRTVAEAAKFIVPVSRSAPEAVAGLRKLAHNRFLSASYDGVYKMKDAPSETMVIPTGQRQIKLDD